MKKKWKVPKFKSEGEEGAFWAKIDLAITSRPRICPRLVPEPETLLASDLHSVARVRLVRLKEQANELRVPYEALIKQYIAQGLSKAS